MTELSNTQDQIVETSSTPASPPLPVSVYAWRRFFARTVDHSTSGLLALFVMAFAVNLLFPDKAKDFAEALGNKVTASFFVVALSIPIEAVLLSMAGNTPAKWLFGISVRTTSGRKLSFGQALKRSFWVALQGEALGIPFVAFFTQFFAYRRLTETGTTLWDAAAECVVTHKTWGAARTIVCVVAVLLVFTLLAILNMIGNLR